MIDIFVQVLVSVVFVCILTPEASYTFLLTTMRRTWLSIHWMLLHTVGILKQVDNK